MMCVKPVRHPLTTRCGPLLGLLRLWTCALCAFLWVSCTHVVTDDSWDSADDSSGETASPDGCLPGCPGGYNCVGTMCFNPELPNCSWVAPGPDDETPMCQITAGGGVFKIGCTEDEQCPAVASPQRGVTLVDATWLDKYEVTNRQYRQYLLENQGALVPDCDGSDDLWNPVERTVPQWLLDHPVVCVTAAQSEAYCRWAGKRLPSEVEWEAGARGDKAWKWPWGDEWDSNAAHCFRGTPFLPGSQCANQYQVDTCEQAATPTTCDETAPVAAALAEGVYYPPFAYSLQGMAGNAAEWTANRWTENHLACPLEGCNDSSLYSAPTSSDMRPVRGGSYENDSEGVTGWSREKVSPDRRERFLGFRCAVGRSL